MQGGDTALIKAASEGYVDIVKMLVLDYGASVDIRNKV